VTSTVTTEVVDLRFMAIFEDAVSCGFWQRAEKQIRNIYMFDTYRRNKLTVSS